MAFPGKQRLKQTSTRRLGHVDRICPAGAKSQDTGDQTGRPRWERRRDTAAAGPQDSPPLDLDSPGPAHASQGAYRNCQLREDRALHSGGRTAVPRCGHPLGQTRFTTARAWPWGRAVQGRLDWGPGTGSGRNSAGTPTTGPPRRGKRCLRKPDRGEVTLMLAGLQVATGHTFQAEGSDPKQGPPGFPTDCLDQQNVPSGADTRSATSQDRWVPPGPPDPGPCTRQVSACGTRNWRNESAAGTPVRPRSDHAGCFKPTAAWGHASATPGHSGSMDAVGHPWDSDCLSRAQTLRCRLRLLPRPIFTATGIRDLGIAHRMGPQTRAHAAGEKQLPHCHVPDSSPLLFRFDGQTDHPGLLVPNKSPQDRMGRTPGLPNRLRLAGWLPRTCTHAQFRWHLTHFGPTGSAPIAALPALKQGFQAGALHAPRI